METITIEFLGQRIHVRTEGDAEIIQEAVRIAQQKLEDVETRSKRKAAPYELAVVALLEVAEEYVQARRRTQDFKKQVETHAAEIRSVLDA